ncbi:hypothetical protein M3C36_10075 [Dietzia cinnamea]|uniref:hypothetical protein n=1 Tax=Dietzia TaxID=37914 RepID=UPI00101AE9CB|nr:MULTISPECIES: hypothetical protein [Dietzia]MCT1885533.1 hypothetical protein [Dietzia cinnamea]
MTSDDMVDQPGNPTAGGEAGPGNGVASAPQAPVWANDAASVDILLDEDDPHASVMELLVGDLEGRLGTVYVGLGPMEVRALLRQLEDVQLAQQIAEWEAEGNDIEDFPLDGRRGDYDGYDDEDDDGSNAVPVNRVGRLTDPLAVKTWMGQDYRLFGIPVQFLLVGMAVVVGVIMAIAGVIL